MSDHSDIDPPSADLDAEANAGVPVVISARPWKYVLFLSGSLAFVAGAIWLADKNRHPGGDPKDLFMALMGLALFGPGAVVFLLGLVLKRPQLVLTPEALRLDNLFGSRIYPWREVGPFSVSKLSHRGGPTYYVCALRDRDHDLLAATGAPTAADHTVGWVRIAVNLFLGRKAADGAQAIADRLNAWRRVHGAPEIDPDVVGDAAARDSLQNSLRRTRRKAFIALIGTVLALAVLFSQAGPLGRLIQNLIN